MDEVPPEYRRLRVWWWVAFTPLAVLIGGIGGLLVRTHHIELARAAAPAVLPKVAPVAPATEGWRWLFTKQEWRGPRNGIGEYRDGLLEFHGNIAKSQTSADAAIRARVVIHGPLPKPAGVFLRSSAAGQFRWMLDPEKRNVRLLDESNGQERELARYRLAKPLAEGERVLLELRASGADITGSINGVEVVRAHDSRMAGAGLWGITGDDMWLEVVEVWEPKAARPIAAVEPPETPVPAEPRAPIATPVPTKPVAATFLPKETTAPAATATPAPAKPASVATTTAPSPMATPAPSGETAKWLASMDAQWRASYQRDVMGPFEKSVVELRRQHFIALGNPLAAAKKAANDAEVAAINAERDLVSKGSNPPVTDDDSTPGALKLARANFRSQFVRLDKERFERARALFAKCDEALAKSQATLTQRQLLEDVASVQKERDQLREAWLQPPAAIATTLPPMSKPTATPAKISAQQIVAKLMELNAAVWVKRGGKPESVEIKSETELGADEKLVFARVDFRPRKRDESPLVPADYAILDSITEVPELGLAGTAVKDAVMEKLRAFRALKNLTLNQAKPSPAGYAVLATLPELHDLTLYDTDANDEAMKSIVQCKKLQRLHLSNLPLTDAGFAEIAKLGALEELGLSGLNKLNSPAFAHFAECRSLKRVYLSGFLVLSGMVENLGKCKELETIGMPAAGLKDADVAPLGGLAKLKALDLAGSAVTGSAFAAWPQRQALLSLNLSNTPGVDDAACKNIEHTFPKLEDLRIKLLPGFSIEGATYLTRLRTLRGLHIEGEGVTDEIVAEFAHRDTITTLSIPLAKLTETGVAAFARMAHLADLSLDMPPITDAAIKSFARCKELKTVHIGKDADPDTEVKFLRNVPGVKVIRPEE